MPVKTSDHRRWQTFVYIQDHSMSLTVDPCKAVLRGCARSLCLKFKLNFTAFRLLVDLTFGLCAATDNPLGDRSRIASSCRYSSPISPRLPVQRSPYPPTPSAREARASRFKKFETQVPHDLTYLLYFVGRAIKALGPRGVVLDMVFF